MQSSQLGLSVSAETLVKVTPTAPAYWGGAGRYKCDPLGGVEEGTAVHNTCPHINAETLLEFMGVLRKEVFVIPNMAVS